MLLIVTYHWGTKYPKAYVDRLRAGLKRHLREPYTFLVIGDGPDADVPIPSTDRPLCEIRGCFLRLRLFDPGFQLYLEEVSGVAYSRIVCVDLDCVVTGPLDRLFARTDSFTILTGANSANPCNYNGSIWMLRYGYRPDVWSDFSLEAAAQIPKYEFADDQGWLHHKLPGVTGWKVGAPSGVYAFKKPGWPKGDDLPRDARMVVFPGWRDPSKFEHLSWVKQHWLHAASPPAA